MKKIESGVLPVSPGDWTDDWLDNDHGWVLDKKGNYLVEAVTEDEEDKVAHIKYHRGNLRMMARAPVMAAAIRLAMVDIKSEDGRDGLIDRMAAVSRCLDSALAKAEGRI